jgi:hypothetical protein
VDGAGGRPRELQGIRVRGYFENGLSGSSIASVITSGYPNLLALRELPSLISVP